MPPPTLMNLRVLLPFQVFADRSGVSRIVAETLESLNMKFPEPTVDINEIKQKYHAIVEEEGGGDAQPVEEPKKQKKKKKDSGKKKKKG